jgi:hypothetical protein
VAGEQGCHRPLSLTCPLAYCVMAPLMHTLYARDMAASLGGTPGPLRVMKIGGLVQSL